MQGGSVLIDLVGLPLSGHRPVLHESGVLSGCACGWPAREPVRDSRVTFVLHCLEVLGADLQPRRPAPDPPEPAVPTWVDEAWTFAPTSFDSPQFERAFINDWSIAAPEPHHPIAEWVVKHLHVTLSPWQLRLLDGTNRKDGN